MEDRRTQSDYAAQIDVIVDDSLRDLARKFPGKTNSDFRLKLRSFMPIVDIIGQFVFETFGYDSAQVHARMDVLRERNPQYEKELMLLQLLKKKEFSRYIELKVMALVEQHDRVTREALAEDYRLKNRHMTPRFLEWIADPASVPAIVSELSKDPEYLNAFSQFVQEELEEHLRSALVYTFQRRFRAGVIKEHVDNNYKRYLREFGGDEIKARLFAVSLWYDAHAQDWFDRELRPFCSVIPAASGLVGKLEANEKIVVAEIIPKDSDGFGYIGGKTVKVCSLDDINKAFVLSQPFRKPEVLEGACQKCDTAAERADLEKTRERFLEMTIARRYIFAEAVDKILHVTGFGEHNERQGIPAYRYQVYAGYYSFAKSTYLENEQRHMSGADPARKVA